MLKQEYWKNARQDVEGWMSGSGREVIIFFFKQKTAYEIGTGDWSSDVCSSDLSQYTLGLRIYIVW